MAQTVKQLCEHLIKQYGEDAMLLRWNVKVDMDKGYGATQNPEWPKDTPAEQDTQKGETCTE